jgi:hypothetical protein
MRTRTRCTVTIGLPIVKALETDLQERTVRELLVKDGAITLDFRPFEIKTVLLTLAADRTPARRAPARRPAAARKPSA